MKFGRFSYVNFILHIFSYFADYLVDRWRGNCYILLVKQIKWVNTMRNAKITRSAFITLCNKIARNYGVSSDFIDITRYGENYVIWRDYCTDTGIARLNLGCSGKPDASGTVTLAEFKTDKGYMDWLRHPVEGNRCDLTQAIVALVEDKPTVCKFNAFPKFETAIPAEHNLITFEEILNFYKKNNIKPSKFTRDQRYLENINAYAPYGCYSSCFANWGAAKDMVAPHSCQTLWTIPCDWGDDSNGHSFIEFGMLTREESDASPVKEIRDAYHWGWERITDEPNKYGLTHHWTEQCKLRKFKCFFYQRFLIAQKNDPYWTPDTSLWIVDSLDKVQEMIDECRAAGFKF